MQYGLTNQLMVLASIHPVVVCDLIYSDSNRFLQQQVLVAYAALCHI
jgi:hypothetical protein